MAEMNWHTKPKRGMWTALRIIILGAVAVLAFLYWPQVKQGGNELFGWEGRLVKVEPPNREEPLRLASATTDALKIGEPSQSGNDPAEERNATGERKYVVRKGDVLSVIGATKGIGWKKLAELNRLKPPYTIHPGQTLYLAEGHEAKAEASKSVTRAPRVTARIPVAKPKALPCIRLGALPFNPKHEQARTLQGIDQLTTLTAEQKAAAKEKVVMGDKASEKALVGTQVFAEMLYQKKDGQVKHVYDKPICTPEQGGVPEVMDTYDLGDGTFFAIPMRCGNPAVFRRPITVVEVPPAEEVPPPVAEAPQEVAPVLPPVSAFPAEDIFEAEGIFGGGVWNNKLAHGRWHYGEGALMAILPDGYRLGVGPYGMWGSGESKVSDYTWRERGFGPQVVLKKNFLQEQTDEFGQTSLLPAMWGLKLRYLPNDRVKGGNPVSGYAQTQEGKKLGLYAEYLARTSPDWLIGLSGEVWESFDRKIKSTWSGDKPQDRGSLAVNLFQQYRISDDWQMRFVEGVSHQNWDKLNFLRVSAEARWQETVMCGPNVAFALNKTAPYKTVSKGDLTTLGFACRLELGDTFRTWDREYRENFVQPVGQVSELNSE